MSGAVEKFKGKSILVVGDVMLDEYVRGSVTRRSPEANAFVLDEESRALNPGGAANVAVNIAALSGGETHVIGLVGGRKGVYDDDGQRLQEAIQKQGVVFHGVIEEGRPTTRKTRFVNHMGEHLLRVDRESTRSCSQKAEADMLTVHNWLEDTRFDAVVISDYRKGVVSPHLIRVICRVCRDAGVPVIGNIKPKTLSFNARGLGLDTLVMNQPEFFEAARQLEYESVAVRLMEHVGCGELVITKGCEGAICHSHQGKQHHIVPGHRVKSSDVSGAGDTFVSVVALCKAAGLDSSTYLPLANRIAAHVVTKPGVATVSHQEALNLEEDLDG